MKIKYKVRKGSKISNREAQVIGEFIGSLKDKDGHITTKKIVEGAKSKKSPIHKYFEWENNKAAEQFRLQQGRNLIEQVVEIVVVAGEQTEQRSYVSVTVINKGKVYVDLKNAIETEDYRKQLLNRAIAILENLTVTLRMFREQEYHK